MPTPDSGIAVVGMACVFPGAPDLDALWRNLQSGADAIREAPADRLDPLYYQPSESARTVPAAPAVPAVSDRFYCRRGGFLDASTVSFDPAAFGVMPVAAEAAEPDQLLTLAVAARALEDAGLDGRADLREQTGVVLGRGAYLTPALARLGERVRTAEELVLALRLLAPSLAEDDLARIKKAFAERLGPYGPDTAIGLVPNLAASRIANRLDLRGPAYTVDAACASALLAIDTAVRELDAGRCDVMVAGGVHVCHDPTMWSVFTQLGALSRRQEIRPFDRRADGILIGEGVGLVVLRRVADAERDGQRIYAVIRGTGVASDGRATSLLTPRVDGQVLALERAWKTAGLDPASVGLVEAHGTATPAGDEAELETLARVFGRAEETASRPVLGSIKSMIGHAMPAAGAAGFIKAALAVHHGALLPTLHCEEPHEKLATTRFRVIDRAEPWPTTGARTAGVNAFGFGGINAHVVLSSHDASGGRGRSANAGRSGRLTANAADRIGASGAAAAERLLAIAADSPAALLQKLALGHDARGEGSVRLAMLDPTPERRERARRVVEKGADWRGHEDLWFTRSGLAAGGGRTVLLFPGVESAFEPRVDDVAKHLGVPVPPHAGAQGLEETGLGIVEVSRLMATALERLGVRADAVAGHSIGEWTAMIVGGMIPAGAADAFIGALRPGTLEVPDVAFVAAGCDAFAAREAIAGLSDIALSHDNCPHQVIVCGREASIATLLTRLRERQVLAQRLPFRSGFHSPLFAPYLEPHRAHVEALALARPQVPLWSATTCEPYPDEPAAVRALVLRHLVEPVRFREALLRMYDQGFRLFVQVGAGSSLVSFVDDTLRPRPHLAIASNVKNRTGLAQLRRVAAALFAEGAPVRLEALDGRSAGGASRPGMTLRLGAPLVRLDGQAIPALAVGGPASAATTPAPATDAPTGGVLGALHSSLRDLATMQSEVVSAWERRRARQGEAPLGPRSATRVRHISVATDPWLLDHCFYRQPAGWPEVADRYPVVPMTMTLELMLEAARALVPERIPIGLRNVRALRWIAVEPPVDLTVRAEYDGGERVSVTIEGYAEGAVELGRAYPAAPASLRLPLHGEHAADVDAARMYTDRWMFHGPRYQGVRTLGPLAEDGIRGELEALAAPGGLLDNAGQLLGFYVMHRTTVDRLAMPVKIDALTLYGPGPAPGERLQCDVAVRALEAREVRADLTLRFTDGRPFCRIDGWEDRRFDSDARLWEVLRFPERNLLAGARAGGVYLVTDSWRNLASRDLIARRYLGAKEREAMERVAPAARGAWLNGRIAVKDAVRDLLWRRGAGPLFPVEIEVSNESGGRPVVRGPFRDDVRVSIGHKEGVAVALAAVGRDVGVDVERLIEPSEGFAEIVVTPDERRLLESLPLAYPLLRAWSAKEAAGKALGTGLGGDPRKLAVRDVRDEMLLVGPADGSAPAAWIATRVDGAHVLAWTEGA
jgi:acyl transferase domain-containing protein/phosphopantetheinyl transferase